MRCFINSQFRPPDDADIFLFYFKDDARNATTVFRDKLGKKRDLDQERLEQKKKNEENAIKLEKYAQWGKG